MALHLTSHAAVPIELHSGVTVEVPDGGTSAFIDVPAGKSSLIVFAQPKTALNSSGNPSVVTGIPFELHVQSPSVDQRGSGTHIGVTLSVPNPRSERYLISGFLNNSDVRLVKWAVTATFLPTESTIDPPRITGQPVGGVARVGDTFVFRVAATGDGITYQWFKDGQPIAGATSSTYTIASVSASDAGSYDVKITNARDSVWSDTATLSVPIPRIRSQPLNDRKPLNGTAEFTIVVESEYPFTYQWRQNGIPLAGQTDATLTVSNVDEMVDGARYSVEVCNTFGCAISRDALLTVVFPPRVDQGPERQVVSVGGSAGIGCHISGTPPFTFQWTKDGTRLAGAAARSQWLFINAVSASSAGSYSLTISNEFFTTSSLPASVIVVPAMPAPVVESFAPSLGAIGSQVTLVGRNFQPTPEYNVVQFGAVRALVDAASLTSLTVTVPVGATLAPISVTTPGGSTAVSGSYFVPTYAESSSGNTNLLFERIDFPTGANPTVTYADLDGDGMLDMAVTQGGIGTLSIFRNKSTYGSLSKDSFEDKVDIDLGARLMGLAVADVDGDGKLDLLVGKVDGYVSILHNRCFRGGIRRDSFAPQVSFPAGANPQGIAVGDLDLDGKIDLAVACGTNPGTISVLRNVSSRGLIEEASFAPFVSIPVGAFPTGVALADVNGDGKAEIISANYNGDTVSVRRNSASPGVINAGSFLEGVELGHAGDGSALNSVAVADMNGDGWLDIVAAAYKQAGAAVVFLNNRKAGVITSSSFAERVEFPTGKFPWSVAVGDLDGDGKPDMVSVNYQDSTISILRNRSQSGVFDLRSFDPKLDVNVGNNPVNVSIGDFDGDGRPDMAIANNIGNSVSVLRRVTGLIPAISAISLSSGNIGSTVVVTGNGFDSRFASNVVYFGGVRARVLNGSSVALTVVVPTGATFSPISVTTPEGLTATSGSYFLPSYPGTGTGNTNLLFERVDFPTGANPTVAYADLDGDGLLDMTVTQGGSGVLSIFRNTNTNGILSREWFAPKVDIDLGARLMGLAVADVDGDGKLDILVGKVHGYISILRNRSMPGLIDVGTSESAVDLPAGSNPQWIAVGDLDGDGKPDVAVACGTKPGTISVIRNATSRGSITATSFAPFVSIPVGAFPTGVALADMNGDGKPEIIAANYAGDTVSVRGNQASPGVINAGSFLEGAELGHAGDGSAFNSVAVADMNGDGWLDIVAAAYKQAGAAVVFPNNRVAGVITSSSFAEQVEFPTGKFPWSVGVGDLDGDGKPDMVSVNYQDSTISILRNRSLGGVFDLGSFDPKLDVNVGDNPVNVSIGDFDGDGKPDIALANNIGNSVSVLRNLAPLAPDQGNDLFANRTAISVLPSTGIGTSRGASKEAGEPSHSGNVGGASVWWTWTAPTNAIVAVDTIGSSFDTLLAVYTGSSLGGLSGVARDDDTGGSGGPSMLAFSALSGVAYQIAVDGFGGASGDIVLHISVVPPSSLTLSMIVTGNQFEISWPSSTVGYYLESTDSLAAPVVWTIANDGVASGANRMSVNPASPTGTRFYRLRKR